MKNLSIAFVTVLSLAAFAGCKKKGGGGDCDSTMSSAVDRMMEDQKKQMPKDMPAEQQKMGEEMMKTMVPKMKATLTKVCTDDKWSPEMLKCVDAAKNMEEGQACNKTLTAEQKTHLDKEMASAMGMSGDHGDMKGGDMKGGDMKGGDMKPADGSGSAAPAGDGSAAPAAAGGGGGDLPKECQDYKAAIDKLSSCDKMPQQARDAMKQGFDTASKAWAGLPADAKASLATGCKAGTDAVNQSAKAVCGW
jgi:hypothetical protein